MDNLFRARTENMEISRQPRPSTSAFPRARVSISSHAWIEIENTGASYASFIITCGCDGFARSAFEERASERAGITEAPFREEKKRSFVRCVPFI